MFLYLFQSYPIPPIIKSEVQKVINMLKRNKAPDPDDIVTEMSLKHKWDSLRLLHYLRKGSIRLW